MGSACHPFTRQRSTRQRQRSGRRWLATAAPLLLGCSHFSYVEVTPPDSRREPSAEAIVVARQIAADVADVYGLHFGGSLPERAYAALYADGALRLDVATGLERAPITFIVSESGAWRASERAELILGALADATAERLPSARVVRWSRVDPLRF